MKSARAIDQHLNQSGRACRNSVRVIVMDGHNVHCLNEEMLDTWFFALTPGEKAELYEQRMADDEERCQFCGCTQMRACNPPCAWLDTNHTVCSAPPCAERYKALLWALTFHPNLDVTAKENADAHL